MRGHVVQSDLRKRGVGLVEEFSDGIDIVRLCEESILNVDTASVTLRELIRRGSFGSTL